MIRLTKQKHFLHQELKTCTEFFDAEVLHARVVHRNRKIGRATVYRFLKQLEKQGEIHAYMCEKRKIYSISKKNHCHFLCEQCGRTQHLSLKKLDFLQKEVAGKMCHFQLDVAGICAECLKKKVFE